MTPSEIIAADARHRNLEPHKVLSVVAQIVGKKVGTILQDGDTVVLLQLLDDSAAQVHLFTVDTPLRLAKALLRIYKTLLQSQLKTLYGKADNPEILDLLRQIGVKVQDSDRPEFNWMAPI